MKLGSICIPTLFFSFNNIVFVILGLLYSKTLKSFCQYSQNNFLGFWFGLHWIYRRSGKDWHLDKVEPFYPCTWIISPFLSLVSFISALNFSSYGSCTYVVRCIHKYFILGDATVDVIVLLISNCALLVYRKAIDFCKLILSPVTLV